YRGTRTKELQVIGTSEKYPDVAAVKLDLGRYFTRPEVDRHRQVAVIGQTPYTVLFHQAGIDPIGKTIRIGVLEYTVIGVAAPRPSPGGFNAGQDDIIVIPESAYRRQYGIKGATLQFGPRGNSPTMSSTMIAALPMPNVSQAQAIADVE